MSPPNLLSLPPEIHLQIASYVHHPYTLCLRATNHYFRTLLQSAPSPAPTKAQAFAVAVRPGDFFASRGMDFCYHCFRLRRAADVALCYNEFTKDRKICKRCVDWQSCYDCTLALAGAAVDELRPDLAECVGCRRRERDHYEGCECGFCAWRRAD